MAKPLRSQLNQIRAWVQQGRTDAWIAHQLEVSAAELSEFRRRHGLNPDDATGSADDLRDAIEAEVEAATLEEQAAAEAAAEAAAVAAATKAAEDTSEDESTDPDPQAVVEGEGEGEARPKRRRRRRRGGGSRPGVGMEASFDHGENDGYGLWIDPSIVDDPIYAEHWKGHRAVELTVEPDRIVIRRSEPS